MKSSYLSFQDAKIISMNHHVQLEISYLFLIQCLGQLLFSVVPQMLNHDLQRLVDTKQLITHILLHGK